jgi:hypothetical protein
MRCALRLLANTKRLLKNGTSAFHAAFPPF